MTRRQRRRKKRDLIEAVARHSPDRLGTGRVCCPQVRPSLRESPLSSSRLSSLAAACSIELQALMGEPPHRRSTGSPRSPRMPPRGSRPSWACCPPSCRAASAPCNATWSTLRKRYATGSKTRLTRDRPRHHLLEISARDVKLVRNDIGSLIVRDGEPPPCRSCHRFLPAS